MFRFNTMNNSKKLRASKLDGLNTVSYELVKTETNNLFVRFYVYYNQTEITNFRKLTI